MKYIFLLFIGIALPGLSSLAQNNIAGTNDLDTTMIYLSVTDPPVFPGGEKALEEYFKGHWGSWALGSGVGSAYVYFVINRQGRVEDAKLVRGVQDRKDLDDEALRLIKGMPDWSIGKQNGHPVKVQFTFPVFFKL
jgi:protein TonB